MDQHVATMDWGIRNRYGYLATSLPWRWRIRWSAQSALLVGAVMAWFVGWVPAAVAFGIGTATNYLMAWVTDFAAWRPAAGICIAALCGAGSGALWWAMTPATETIWLPMTVGTSFCLTAVWSLAEVLRRLGPPQR